MADGNLKYQFNRLNIAEKLIAINVIVFLVNSLFPFLLGISKNSIVQWFELPNDFFDFLVQPWSIITYSFFHGGFGHLFWNMLLIYFVGRIFLNLFDSRRFLNVYFLGVILGGLFFVVGYNIFPAFFNINAYLIGASAGASAILIFICTYMPNQEAPLKTVYRKNNATTKSTKAAYEKQSHQKKIDAILDKISKSGYESLSKSEKDFLFKAGKEN